MQTILTHPITIPALGFGTFQLEGTNVVDMVKYALDLGYRHIDTAQIYENETEVGQAMQAARVPRDEIFLTTKVWINRFSRDELPRSVEESLTRLQTEYVDLLLLHWPNPNIPLAETLEALMAVQAAGKARHIGVSNFTTALMQDAADICGQGVLVNNQVEYHPYLLQDKVISKARELGMVVTAYRPIAKGKVMHEPTLTEIADRHGKTAVQVTLRWIIQQGLVAIPRSSKPDHAKQNFEIFDFSLSDDEMAAINALRGNERLISPESLAPEWDTPDPVLSA